MQAHRASGKIGRGKTGTFGHCESVGKNLQHKLMPMRRLSRKRRRGLICSPLISSAYSDAPIFFKMVDRGATNILRQDRPKRSSLGPPRMPILIVNHPLAVFFCEGITLWCREYVQHYLGRTT